jgi:phage-related protein
MQMNRFRDTRRFDRVVSLIDPLRQFGHELRRPVSGHLGGGIHELRARAGRAQIRVLYFFHGTERVVLAVVCRKEEREEHTDLWSAIRAKALFEVSPEAHAHEEEGF